MQLTTDTQPVTSYEQLARETALAWSQSALSTTDPAFDIVSSEQRDMHGTIVASHRLNVEHQIRRWSGCVALGSDDIPCDTREAFDEGLKQQGLLALYDESVHADLVESITSADYAASRQPAYRAVNAPRLLYHQYCDHCHATGTQSCPNCSGAGETRCGGCAGDGTDTCGSCGGSGQQEFPSTDSHGHHHTEWSNCPGCAGTGHIDCSSCGGNGWKSCCNCHRTGTVSCSACEGTGSVTDVGQIALVHTPEYRVTFDNGSPEAALHVLNFFGHAGFAEQAEVQFDSVQRVEDTYTATTFNFSYRFQLLAAQISVKTRRYFFGADDYTEWTVVGKRSEVIDCDLALFPLLLGASIDLQRMTRWKSAWRPGYNQRVSKELNSVLKPGVHQWIIDAVNRNRSIEETEIEIRRGLDPLSIAAIVNNVSQALKMTYRRRMLLHHAAATLITLLCMLMTSKTFHYLMQGLLASLPNQGIGLSVKKGIAVMTSPGALCIVLAAVAIMVVISFHVRHRVWLRRAGYDALWARAMGLGHLNVGSTSLQISGLVLLVAMLSQAVITGR